jgi:hypothetical protein
MHDAVQRLPLLLVAEGDRGQRGPVERAVVGQDLLAERIDELGQALGARLDDFTGYHIAVDDDSAELTEC